MRIGTRDSKLALAQAEIVAGCIRSHHPDIDVRLVTMKSAADMNLEVTLDKLGGKGVFVKELDEALMRGDVDICVHSFKDVPSELHPSIPLVATGQREDPRDVLVLPKGADEPDASRPLGCSSLRRCVQLAELYPNHQTAPIRGNIITRLKKLDNGDYGALVLAAAGLIRVDLWDRASRAFSVEEMIPAGCQGVIAVQGRKGEDYSYLNEFNHADTWDATMAERAFVRRLNCGCGAPVGVYATIDDHNISISAIVADEGGALHRAHTSGLREAAAELGEELAGRMLERAVL